MGVRAPYRHIWPGLLMRQLIGEWVRERPRILTTLMVPITATPAKGGRMINFVQFLSDPEMYLANLKDERDRWKRLLERGMEVNKALLMIKRLDDKVGAVEELLREGE